MQVAMGTKRILTTATVEGIEQRDASTFLLLLFSEDEIIDVVAHHSVLQAMMNESFTLINIQQLLPLAVTITLQGQRVMKIDKMETDTYETSETE